MSIPLIITRTATLQLEELAAYAAEKGSVQSKLSLLEAVANKLELIARNPHMYRRSTRMPDMHECVVNTRTIMLYRPAADKIEVMGFIDTRRDIS